VTRNGSTRQWRTIRDRVLKASDICHICGQPGADSVDHLIAVANGGTNDPTNLKPAHYDVPPHCNRIKSDKAYAPIVRTSRNW
jgi:5-methylcytosine-specific restriction protein A